MLPDTKIHFIMLKGQFFRITIRNLYAPNSRDSKYMKQKLMELKGEIDNSTITVGDFSSPLLIVRRQTKHICEGIRVEQQYKP